MKDFRQNYIKRFTSGRRSCALPTATGISGKVSAF